MEPMSSKNTTHFQTALNNLEYSTRQCLSNESTGGTNPAVSETTLVSETETSKGTVAHKTVFICEFCGVNKPHPRELSSHLLTHIGAMPYYCLKCPFSSISLTQLYIHLVKHIEFVDDDLGKQKRLKTVLARMVHVCNLCALPFKYHSDLISHYLVHIRSSFKCIQCSFVFLLESDCLIHSHLHSFGTCRVCSRMFSSNKRNDYLPHVLTHDHTKLYRKFPRIQVDHKTVPYYKSFFDICFKISRFATPLHWSIGDKLHCVVNQSDVNPSTSNKSLSESSDQFDINLAEICEVVLEEESAFSSNIGLDTDFNNSAVANQKTYESNTCAIECQQVSNTQKREILRDYSFSVGDKEMHQNFETVKGLFKKKLPDCAVDQHSSSVSDLKNNLKCWENPIMNSEVGLRKSDAFAETNVEDDTNVIQCIDLGEDDVFDDQNYEDDMVQDSEVRVVNDSVTEVPLNMFSASNRQKRSSRASPQKTNILDTVFLRQNLTDKVSNQEDKYKPVNAVHPFTSSRGEELISLLQKRDSLNFDSSSNPAFEDYSTNSSGIQNLDYSVLKKRLTEPQFCRTVASMLKHSRVSSQHSNLDSNNPSVDVLPLNTNIGSCNNVRDHYPMNKHDSHVNQNESSSQTINKSLHKRICALRIKQNLLPVVSTYAEDGVQVNKISSQSKTAPTDRNNVENCLMNRTKRSVGKLLEEQSSCTVTSTQTCVQDNNEIAPQKICDQSCRSDVNNCLLKGRKLTVALNRLPDEIFSVVSNARKEIAENGIVEKPYTIKELVIVLDRLPPHVIDLNSFNEYDRERKRKQTNASRREKRRRKMEVVKLLNETLNQKFKNSFSLPPSDNHFTTESSISNSMRDQSDMGSSDVHLSQQNNIAESREIISPLGDMVNMNENLEIDRNQINGAFGDNSSSQVETVDIISSSTSTASEPAYFDMVDDADFVGLHEHASLKCCHVFDDIDCDELAKSHVYRSTKEEIGGLKSRIHQLNNLLESVKQIQKQPVCKELHVSLFKLPNYILEKHLKRKPIMVSNLLPVIHDVQSLNE